MWYRIWEQKDNNNKKKKTTNKSLHKDALNDQSPKWMIP